MHPLIESIQETGIVHDASGTAWPAFPRAMAASEAARVQEMVEAAPGPRVLEIGLGYGVAAIVMCEALAGVEGASLLTMDPFQHSDCHGIGLANLERAGFSESVAFHEESSHVVLPRLLEAGCAFDFALIDGAHLFDNVIVDWFYVDKLLRVGGIIGVDDVHMLAIQKTVAFIVRNRNYEVIIGHVPNRALIKARRAVKSVLPPRIFGGLRSMMRRGRAFNRPTTPLVFLKKGEPRTMSSAYEALVDF